MKPKTSCSKVLFYLIKVKTDPLPCGSTNFTCRGKAVIAQAEHTWHFQPTAFVFKAVLHPDYLEKLSALFSLFAAGLHSCHTAHCYDIDGGLYT